MKTSIKFGLLLALGLLIAHMASAGHLDGWWVSDRNQRMEIRGQGNRLLVSSSQHRQAETFMPVPGTNAYRSQAGELMVVLDEEKLEMSDRQGNHRTLYYKQMDLDTDRFDPNHAWQDNYGSDARRYDGEWFNPSTGLRLQISSRNRSLRVRFQRDRWTNFHLQRGRYYVDERGNTLTFDRQGITYRSYQGDLMMVFTQGRGGDRCDNPFFEDFARRYDWN